ncbi:MAG: hypothetical protein NZM12_08290, partial [Steroidobacteraceae bacterium]|nr:hypothetical protein [Steroidobacteraceae bacterium]
MAKRPKEPEVITLRKVPPKTPDSQRAKYVVMPENADPELFDEEPVTADDVVSVALSSVLEEVGAHDDDAKVQVFRMT